MEIQTVKIQDEGYLVNGTLSVPKADGNRHYQMVKEWIAQGNIPEPQFTEAEQQTQQESDFRHKREPLLKEADITINKLEDIGQDSTAWRQYRQALRDATATWIMPTKPV